MPTTHYPFGLTLADVAITVYGRSIIVAPQTAFRFYSDQAMTSEITDILDSDGVSALTPGTLTTLKSGAFPLFYLPVIEAWAFPNGAPADAQPALIQCHQSALPTGSGTGAALTGGTAWQATHAYAVGNVFVKPSDGSTRVVNTAYTSGAAYTGTDDTNSVQVAPAPPTSSAILAATAGSYAPFSGAYRQVAFRTGQRLFVGLELDGSGIDMPAAGTVNQIVATDDFFSVGNDVVAGLWQLNSSNVETQVAAVPILAGKVGTVWQVQRTDTVTVTSGSATVTGATAITVYDKGRKITGTGIPANTFVGQTMTPGTSFKLSSSATSQVDVTATANGTSVVIGAAISFAKDDQFFCRTTQVGSTFPGQGLKVRLMLGTETARVNTTPGVPSGLAVTGTTSNSVTLSWTLGSNSSQTILLRDGAPYALLGTTTTYTDLGPNGTGLTSADAGGHTYAVAARRGNACSAATSTVTGAPTTDYVIVPQALSGAMDGTKSTVTLGSSSGTAATFGTGGLVLTTTSGAAGGFSANDKVNILFVGDTGNYSAWRSKGKFIMSATTDILTFNLSCNSSIATSYTNGVQWTLGAFSYNVAFKAASFGSGSGGTGTNGSSQALTDSAYPITSATTTASGGSVTLGSSLVAGTEYGYKIQQTNNGDGTQTVQLYLGTAAQYASDTMPLLNTITLNATMKTAMAAGRMNVCQNGVSAASSVNTQWTAMIHTPVAA